MATETLASSRWFDPSTRWAAFLGFFMLLLSAGVTVTDALMRGFLNAPLYGWADMSQLVYAIVIVACFPAGLLQGHNITIRFLGSGLGPRATHWLEVFAQPFLQGVPTGDRPTLLQDVRARLEPQLRPPLPQA